MITRTQAVAVAITKTTGLKRSHSIGRIYSRSASRFPFPLAPKRFCSSASPTPENDNNNNNNNNNSDNNSSSNDSPPHWKGFDLNASDCNVPPHIAARVGKNLYLQPNHPLHTIKKIIQDYWETQSNGNMKVFDSELSPMVSTHDNFDSLLIPPDHVSRSYSDTYYLNSTRVLRTHTSAHQVPLLRENPQVSGFLITGDVYRRDEIDKSHYPIFHQMEGVKLFTPSELKNEIIMSNGNNSTGTITAAMKQQIVMDHLKQSLGGMAQSLFGKDIEMRWIEAYFPFTDPSVELEIYYQDEWLEVLGAGMVQPYILEQAKRRYLVDDASTSDDDDDDKEIVGWAFGLGLERLAMVLFGIPDIRLFWTEDSRFHEQFSSGDIVKFQPYSKYPPCYKDISFWLPSETETSRNSSSSSSSPSSPGPQLLFHVNDLNEVVRQVAGDLVEQVDLVDEFVHPKTKRTSHCYRISYRSMDRSLTNEEIDALQKQVRDSAVEKLKVELR